MNSRNQDTSAGTRGDNPDIRHRTQFPKALLFILVFICPIAFFTFLDGLFWSPYITNTHNPVTQEVPFSHKHHAAMGIDCRYCHSQVETSAIAGIPPTRTCMNCHSEIFKEEPMLAPVRHSLSNNVPLQWNRVHDLPDFVYFNHSIHVNKGIGCTTCHGQVDDMPLMMKQNTLNMAWCTECHRAPEKYIRPRDQVFNLDYVLPPDQLTLGEKLVSDYNVDRKNDHLAQCYKCHR